MKILKAIYEHLVRLVISIAIQLPWVVVGVCIFFYVHQTFPVKINDAFGVAEAQVRLDQATESTIFMKNMISVSNPMASVNYLTSLVNQTVAWSRLNTSKTFANVITVFSLWLIDVILVLAGIYLIWKVFKVYRLKGRQKESARIVSKELAPYFKNLQDEIQALREEIKNLKNEKSGFTDSPDPRV